MQHRAQLALALVVVATACGQDRPKASPPPAASDAATATASPRGHAAIAALKDQLRAALSKALEGGAPNAVEVCGTAAKAIADGLATDGMKVGRATPKPRNPANAVAGWQAEALAEFEAAAAAGKKLDGVHYLRQLPDGQTRYAEPLVVQALCLKCHGADVAPDVKAAIAAAYPADQATGYAEGALRGLAWAEYRATP
ncbi:MAG: DUF3365 domain-containing protein [Myxococcales bacterium]|nr:DUF3365 domain-containing protein [Myxococcales bacterium]